jgi:hypothetical protein
MGCSCLLKAVSMLGRLGRSPCRPRGACSVCMVEFRRTVNKMTVILLPHVYGTEICVMITGTRTRTQFIFSQRSTKYGCIYICKKCVTSKAAGSPYLHTALLTCLARSSDPDSSRDSPSSSDDLARAKENRDSA